MNALRSLDRSEFCLLADTLGDGPETTISVHLLRRGLCHAYVSGDPRRFEGAIVQDDSASGEPMAFGSDPQVLWKLLKIVKGWDCVNVTPECAAPLGYLISTETGECVRYYGDIYHVLPRPARRFQNEAVRRVTLSDLELLASTPREVRGEGFGSLQALLQEGFVACAVVSGQVVSVAHTYARTARHADIGVHTLEGWRGRGFATAAASIVAGCIQEAGQVPVWSTGEDNWASLRVAQKLGFTEVSRRTYVIRIKSNQQV
jgi:GNAT superfamily N-acetyltransferase